MISDITLGTTQDHDPGDSMGSRPHDPLSVMIEVGATGAHSSVLPDGRVLTVLVQSAEDAGALAVAPRTSSGDLYTTNTKPVARAVADALARQKS